MLKKTAMIHGRPSGHPLHKKYGESISAEFIPVDFILRWHDNNSSSIRKYLSWFLCAVFFPNKKKYDVFLCEGPHLMVALMKCLSIIKKHQKVILLLDDETLYFLYTNRYNKITKTALKWFIKKSDGVICPGVLGKKLVNSLNLVSDNKIKLLFNGVEETRLNNLLQISPNLNSFNIVFIGNISGEWRAWYKGFDLLLVTLEKLQCKIPNLTLTVIGDIEPDFYEPYSRKLAPTFFSKIIFLGHKSKIEDYLTNYSLCVHCGRGEAWGISINETMAAGIPTIVSEWTGAKDAVIKVDTKLICDITVESLYEKINWYFNLTKEMKIVLSNKSKSIASNYTEK